MGTNENEEINENIMSNKRCHRQGLYMTGTHMRQIQIKKLIVEVIIWMLCLTPEEFIELVNNMNETKDESKDQSKETGLMTISTNATPVEQLTKMSEYWIGDMGATTHITKWKSAMINISDPK